MSVNVGTRLGSLEITALLGKGGMGEVYRARDTKLKRDVAIKILPEEFSRDADRVSRFQREAEVLASLNHPNVAAIYDLQETNGLRFLVLELVEGETLADRIARGPIPVEETLEITEYICEALEAAHEKGIIHRDLKPANVKISPDGKVKILDFGLAKALGPPEGEHVSQGVVSGYNRTDTESPTIGCGATQAGVILGTAAYMSPEQAKGRSADKRSDVWAFGCVLYEMLTATRAFAGDDVSDTLARVLTREPDWDRLPDRTPLAIRTLLRRCLAKDLTRRLHHIADARIELDEALRQPAELRATTRVTHANVAWTTAIICLVALASTLAFSWSAIFHRSVDMHAYRSSILLPEGVRFRSAGPPSRFALSPDGRRFAFVTEDKTGETMLWVRALDTAVAQPIAGTNGAIFPFWSPDSRFIAFLSKGKLKKVEAAGGSVITLCDAASYATGTWNRNDVILFTPKGGDPLYRVSASGGVPAPATTLDTASGDTQHWYPFFLPDDRHFLYFVLGSKTGGIDPRAVYVGSLDPNEPSKLLLQGGSNAKYAEGYLIFLRGRTLMAQPFDMKRLELTGDAVILAEEVQVPGTGDIGNAGAFSVAETGALVYQTGLDIVRSQLAWFDRGGKAKGLLGDQADYGDVALSRDGQRAAVSVLDPATGTRDLWIYDLPRGLRTRFTFDPADEIAPVWSADGSRIMFSSSRKSGFDVYQKLLSGPATEDAVLEGGLGKYLESASADGRFLLYVFGSGTLRRSDLWVLPLSGDRKPFPFVETPFVETQGQFSSDGHWIAYTSNESGRYEIYVAPFPGPGTKIRISTAGGSWPRWRRDGKEIFYLAPDNTLTVATVSGHNSSFNVDAVRPLFVINPRPQVSLGAFPYDVSPDGQRFLVNTFVEETASAAVSLVTNWTAGLKK